MKASTFRALVSGQRHGPLAAVTRCCLRLAELPYSWAVRCRNHAYDVGKRSVLRLDVPVISVGNLTLGGTGKTPTVEWLARHFLQQQYRVAIVSRGYGTQAGKLNDEAMELAEKLPEVPHVQNSDRVAAARRAVRDHNCQLILLDDGFQHRRLARDLDLVLIDSLEPFGFEHIFPRGTLREPVTSLQRADVIALTRADMVDEQQRKRIRRRVRKLARNAVWLEIVHQPTALMDIEGNSQPLDQIENQRIAAFCGIGNPVNFRRTLSQCSWDVVGWREFADHHDYSPSDVESLQRWSENCGSNALVCTRKDLVKLREFWPADMPLYALTVETKIVEGLEKFYALLDPLLSQIRKK
ncbi:MAG: tetraacyldisaccharide 4'-kinase [Planctomycetales bacterium]